MKRFENHGENLFDEFNIKISEIKEEIKSKFNSQVKIKLTRDSPEIGLSSGAYFYSVQVKWWEIINNGVAVGNIESMLDNTGGFYEIDQTFSITTHKPPIRF